MSFSALGLSQSLLKAIQEQGYTSVYPIQEQAIPAVLKGRDVLGIAQTGSGKTASFALPILELLQKKTSSKNRFVKALVLVPTRELAVQVEETFYNLSIHLPNKVKALAVYGGVSINPQMMKLSGTDVLIATPGRLLDLVDHNAVKLSEVEILVLDEADKMLNLGFKEEMDRIFALLPSRRQNLLFSATFGGDVETIVATQLQNPLTIKVEEEASVPELIDQVAYLVSPEKKGPFLRYLLKQENMQQVLVFASSIRTADNIVGKLKKNGIEAAALHGDKSQGARTEALKLFKAGKLRVLVATDLASRGIDIKFLPSVINYELPRSPKDYVHRIGRTGRAEASGKAISLITPEDAHHFKIIQKKMGKQVTILPADEIDLPFTIQNEAGEKLTFTKITVKDGEEYLEAENEVQPGAGPPMHVHYKQDECLTVVSGKMGYQELGVEPGFASPGESILFKAGTPHKFWNAGTDVLYCKGYITPPDNVVYYLSEVYKSLNKNGGRPGMYDSAFLLNRYKTEFGMLEIPAFVQKILFPIVLFIGNLTGKHKKFADAPPPLYQ